MGAKKKADAGITVIVDSREQTPLDFAPYAAYGVTAERAKLHAGDYSVRGYDKHVMSLCIKRFCTDEAKHDCIHCAGWEVDGVDENGCHTICFEYECQCLCDGCKYEKKGEVK